MSSWSPTEDSNPSLVECLVVCKILSNISSHLILTTMFCRLNYLLTNQKKSGLVTGLCNTIKHQKQDLHPALAPAVAFSLPPHQKCHLGNCEANERKNPMLWVSQGLSLPFLFYHHLWSCTTIKKRSGERTYTQRKRK
jgi:hypothetical protein